MLVLSRKPGERIMIGEDVVVTVVRIGPNNVRIGIDAPRDLNIVREELCSGGTSPAVQPAAEPRQPSPSRPVDEHQRH